MDSVQIVASVVESAESY